MGIMKKTEMKFIFTFMNLETFMTMRVDFFDSVDNNILLILQDYLSDKTFISFIEKPRNLNDILLGNCNVVDKIKEIINIHTPIKIEINLDTPSDGVSVDDVTSTVAYNSGGGSGIYTDSSNEFSEKKEYP